VTKLDLLFMIDNSISMSDKQEVLRLAVPDLVSRLVNPACVDAAGVRQAPPPSGERACPPGQTREFAPIDDINIGIISSSIGDSGANAACPPQGFPNFVADRDDHAHLMGSLARGQVSGANSQGFLEWRAGADLARFNADFQIMLQSVGESGCGWEASLEAWYRFLVDPAPASALERVTCPGSTAEGLNCVAPSVDQTGRVILDQTLLAQRAAFLCPDSLVAVVMLSDENDCSLQTGDQTWVALAIDDARPMLRGSSICDQNANDKCCYSCPLGPPEGCTADPICAADAVLGTLENRLPATADGKNLRCFEQKRRFGTDFLYPTQRYVNALSQRELCLEKPDLSTLDCSGTPQPNPLYAGGRSPDRVFLAGVVGVPWQSLASNVDLKGRPIPSSGPDLRFKPAAELSASDWANIVGSPGTPFRAAASGAAEVPGTPPVPPADPHMRESATARPDIIPGNAINGRDFDTAAGEAANGTPDDLEYACIFPLRTPRDCTQRDITAGDACDCYAGDLDRPLCEATPGNGAPGTTQFWAKAYPGLRQLQVLKDYGANSIVASICARNVSDDDQPDFGYRPAMSALIERLQPQLSTP